MFSYQIKTTKNLKLLTLQVNSFTENKNKNLK